MIKTLIAIAVAGAFALPVAALASAGSDNIVVAQAGGADAATSGGQAGSNPPGTASPGSPRDATTSTDRDTGATGRANPSTGASSTRMGFERLDKNHDGFISRDEAKDAAELNTRFSELDKDNDGKLSREEYNALDTSARGSRVRFLMNATRRKRLPVQSSSIATIRTGSKPASPSASLPVSRLISLVYCFDGAPHAM